MAALTWYLTNTAVDTIWQELSETAPGSATSSPNVGWTVAKVAATNYSAFLVGTERASGTFGATALPAAASLNTGGNGDGLRTTNKYTGAFASANWSFTFEITAVGAGGTQDGRFRLRLYRSVNANGSSATEITSAVQTTTTVTNLATSATTELTLTFNPGAFSVSGEYLFVQLAWEISGAGGSNSCDVILRVGANETRIVTSTFTPAFTGSGSSAMSGFASSGNAAEEFPSSGTSALTAFASSGTGTAGSSGTTGSGSSALQPFAGSGVGSEKFTASGTSALATFAASGSGSEKFVCSGGSAFRTFASSGVASEKFTGSGSSAFAQFAATGVGAVANNIGSGSSAIRSFASSGSGSERFPASGSSAFMTFAGSGAATERFTASGTGALKSFACTGNARERFAASGTSGLASFACSGSGTTASGNLGSGSSALAAFASSGVGAECFSGSGTSAIAPFACTGADSVPVNVQPSTFVIRFNATFTNASGWSSDSPNLRVVVTAPDGAKTTLQYRRDTQLIRVAPGRYVFALTVGSLGTWHAEWFDGSTSLGETWIPVNRNLLPLA